MRRRLVQGLVASVMAVAVSLPGGARPAQAWDVGTVTAIINATQAAYNLWKQFTGGDKALEQAVAQIVARIESAKAAIITHVDQLAAAEAKACARHAVTELTDIDNLDPITLRVWAQDVTGCVTLVESLLSTVSDQGVIDSLGFALNVVGPIALVARARAGLSTSSLTGSLIDANSTVIARYDPPCARSAVAIVPSRGVYYYTWTCTASNTDSAKTSLYVDPDNGFPYYVPDLVPVKAQAARNTSKPLAASVIPLLRA